MPAPAIAIDTPIADLRVMRDQVTIRAGIFPDAELARQALQALILAREEIEDARAEIGRLGYTMHPVPPS